MTESDNTRNLETSLATFDNAFSITKNYKKK